MSLLTSNKNWLPRKDSHLHKNVNSVPCYFDTTRELKIDLKAWILLPLLGVHCISVLISTDSLSKDVYWISPLFHLLITISSDCDFQCLSVSIHYLLLHHLLLIGFEPILPPYRGVVLPFKLRMCCLHLMYLKIGIRRKNRTYPRAFGEPVA